MTLSTARTKAAAVHAVVSTDEGAEGACDAQENSLVGILWQQREGRGMQAITVLNLNDAPVHWRW